MLGQGDRLHAHQLRRHRGELERSGQAGADGDICSRAAFTMSGTGLQLAREAGEQPVYFVRAVVEMGRRAQARTILSTARGDRDPILLIERRGQPGGVVRARLERHDGDTKRRIGRRPDGYPAAPRARPAAAWPAPAPAPRWRRVPPSSGTPTLRERRSSSPRRAARSPRTFARCRPRRDRRCRSTARAGRARAC